MQDLQMNYVLMEYQHSDILCIVSSPLLQAICRWTQVVNTDDVDDRITRD